MKSYYYWMRIIKQEAFDSLPTQRKKKVLDTVSSYPAPLFTEIRLPNKNVSPNISSALILRLNGATLEIHNGASDAVIESTLRALKNYDNAVNYLFLIR